MSFLLLFVVFAIIIYLSYQFVTGKPPNTPPGIPRLPIVGSYTFLLWGDYKFPFNTLKHYIKKYNSKLISCYLGDAFTVIANDYQSVREVLAREEFDGRPADLFLAKARAFGKCLGIFFTHGKQWQEQRRFALRNLRDFGFGRRQEKLENEITEEVRILIDLIRNGPINDDEKRIVQGDAVLFPDVLYAAMGNSIWVIMTGEKMDRSEHEQLRTISRAAMLFQRSSETTGGMIGHVRWLRYFGNIFSYKDILKGNYGLVNFIKEYVRERRSTFTEDLGRGFVDRYLEVLKEKGEVSHFSEEQLIMSITDVVFPALTAVTAVITHCIKYMMHCPKVCKNVQEEIDKVVGTGRLVVWDDRKDLPYTEAVLREVMRMVTLTPFGVFHASTKATTLCGYTIPKGTVVVTNLAVMHEDPDFWGDPENFRPERFLSENGDLVKDHTMPFGLGHRVCAGETFARYTLFGLFANLMQNFEFSFVEGQPTSLTDKLPGLIITPKDTWIRVRPRSEFIRHNNKKS